MLKQENPLLHKLHFMFEIMVTYQLNDIIFRLITYFYDICKMRSRRSQWQRCLRRRSAASRLLGLRIQIPSAALMSVCCECCVLSGRIF